MKANNLIGKTVTIKKGVISGYEGKTGVIAEHASADYFFINFGDVVSNVESKPADNLIGFHRNEFTVKRSPVAPKSDWKNTTRPDNYRVTTWWDRKSRNYITQLLDVNAHQIGDAIYSGHKTDAKVSHGWLQNDAIITDNELSSFGFGYTFKTPANETTTSTISAVKKQSPIPFGIGVNGMGVAVDCHKCFHVSYPASTDNTLEYTCPYCGSFAWGTDERSELKAPATTFKLGDNVIIKQRSNTVVMITGITVDYGKPNRYSVIYPFADFPDTRTFTADELTAAPIVRDDHQQTAETVPMIIGTKPADTQSHELSNVTSHFVSDATIQALLSGVNSIMNRIGGNLDQIPFVLNLRNQLLNIIANGTSTNQPIEVTETAAKNVYGLPIGVTPDMAAPIDTTGMGLPAGLMMAMAEPLPAGVTLELNRNTHQLQTVVGTN